MELTVEVLRTRAMANVVEDHREILKLPGKRRKYWSLARRQKILVCSTGPNPISPFPTAQLSFTNHWLRHGLLRGSLPAIVETCH